MFSHIYHYHLCKKIIMEDSSQTPDPSIDNLSSILEAAGVSSDTISAPENTYDASSSLPTPQEMEEIKKSVGSVDIEKLMANVTSAAKKSKKVTPDMDTIMNEVAKAVKMPPAPNPQSDSSSNAKTPPAPDQREEIRAAMQSVDVNSIISKLAADPTQASEALSQASPETMQLAQKMAVGSQGDQLRKAMMKKGMSPNQLKAQMKNERKLQQALKPKDNSPKKKACFIGANRKIKMIDIPVKDTEAAISPLFHSEHAVKMPCSRLAVGPLSNKSISIWYDPEDKRMNKRAARICGFRVGGNIIILCETESITAAQVEGAERQLR
jgi:hypothetical protein